VYLQSLRVARFGAIIAGAKFFSLFSRRLPEERWRFLAFKTISTTAFHPSGWALIFGAEIA
jgi:hypothetical protein